MSSSKFRPLLPYMKKYWKGYLAGTLSVLGNNGFWVLWPLVIRHIVRDLDTGVTHAKLLRWCLLLIGVAAGKGVFQYLTRWIVIGISREIEFDLRNDLFRRLEALDAGFYQRHRTGDIMARATNDLNAVRTLLGPAIMYSANTVAFTAGALFFMTRISPRLTLFAFLPLPIASIIVQYFGVRIHERFERIQAKFSDISARAQENFSGARLIRAYAQEDAEIASFERDNQDYIHRAMPLARLMGMLWPTLEAMLGLATVIVLWVGGREVLLHRMDLGSFVAFNAYMGMLMWPVIALGWVINIFQRGTASMGRIDEILSQEPTIADDAKLITVAPETVLRGEIEFRDLVFAYDRRSLGSDNAAMKTEPGAPVLKGVSLKVEAGTSLAIVGPTGSGKSTLVSLLPRIQDATAGTLLIDGRPIREYPLETLRRQIGFVPQETFLFSTTVRENIAFGVDDATDKQIARAAEISRIAVDVEGFPEKYATMVGERGLTLSGGQKQRVAIARAVIREPRILILDDALASVDTHTEDHILNGLREVMQGRTTIFISHRVSTVRNADRIAVLHDGHVVEYGTDDELIALNGYYTGLHNKQLLEEELETA